MANNYVCGKCFDDYAIKKYIYDKAVNKACDYCGNKAEKPIAAPIDDVVNFIVEGIKSEWGNPNDEGIPWDREEDAWAFDDIHDGWDLIYDGHVDLTTDNDTIMGKVFEVTKEQSWCRKDFYILPEDDALKYGWEQFAHFVKHDTRYFFLHHDKRFDHDNEVPPPYAMLDYISQIISEINLIKTVPTGYSFLRGRCHECDEVYDKAKELGSPLPDVVKFSNRMSPAGVPMFYGAFDEDTVLKEICEKRANSQIVTIGTFKTLCDFEILDLTSIPNMPSIFDKKKRETRSKILFLQSFVREIQKSIKKDGREHIEYVPTQILTEYYRRIFNTKSREKLMGIFYPSTQNKGRTCCVLFVQNENCYNVGEKEDNGKKMLLQLVSTKRISIP